MEEVGTARVTWRKSTRSNGSGDCIEVADNLAGKVGLRDSKDPSGPVLAFDQRAWSLFIRGVKRETFSHSKDPADPMLTLGPAAWPTFVKGVEGGTLSR